MFTILVVWLPTAKHLQGLPMQTTGSYSNPEHYAEISGNDLNGKAFPLQEDVGNRIKKKKNTDTGNNKKKRTR